MTRLGIIPAGGKAERFGGVMKEMLPCGDMTLLERCVSAMERAGADEIVVLTTPEKIAVHARALQGNNVTFRLSRGTLWASMCEAMNFGADEYLFAMPDTYFPLDALKDRFGNFFMGLFRTDTPARFGVYHEGQIWDKYFESGEYLAWGVLSWSRKVANFWKGKHYDNHTCAFNDALRNFGTVVAILYFYNDMASFSDYRKLVLNV